MKEIDLIDHVQKIVNEYMANMITNEFHEQTRRIVEAHAARVKIAEEYAAIKQRIFHKETQKIVEEHAAAERAIQNNGWVDFEIDYTEDLIDVENYLIRQMDCDGGWRCPHLAYWCKEDQEFCLLHTLMGMAPKVDQYFKIPE